MYGEPLTSSASSPLRRSNSLGHSRVHTVAGRGRGPNEHADLGLHALGQTRLEIKRSRDRKDNAPIVSQNPSRLIAPKTTSSMSS